MEVGKVYVVHNDWIRDPDTTNGTGMPYKIGITTKTVDERYYGLGLKMPGTFVCDFAYEFSENYDKVEKALHDILNESNKNGEWFNLNAKALDGIRSICRLLGGKLVAEDDDIPDDPDKPAPVIPLDDWKKNYPWVTDAAECLKGLLVGTIENLGVEYKQKNIAFTSANLPSSRNRYLYITRGSGEPSTCSLAFRVKDDARPKLDALLNENGIEHTLEGEEKIFIKPISKQLIEQHKEAFIKIAEYVKDYKEQ